MAKKKKTLYKKSLLIYTCFIACLVVAAVLYVSYCVKEFEKYDLDNYIKVVAKDLDKNDLKDMIDFENLKISKYEKYTTKSDIIKGIDKSLEDGSKITYKENENSKDLKNPIYDVYYNDSLVFTVKLLNKGNVQKIKLLNYTLWEVDSIESHIGESLYEIKAELPEEYKLYINDKEVKEYSDSEDKLFSLLSTYGGLKGYKHYKVDNLINKPKYMVKDKNGKVVNAKIENDVITVFEDYFMTDDNEEAQKKLVAPFDVLSLAEKYSLFLTKDLAGAENGFATLKPYVIQGTDVYKMMYDWAHGIDITFTSKHSLKNPPFTNEKLENFVIYSDKAFTVEVTLEKNMLLVTGKSHTVKMHDRLTFVYYNGGWKLIKMESI